MHNCILTGWQVLFPLIQHRSRGTMWQQWRSGFWKEWNQYMHITHGSCFWNPEQRELQLLIMAETWWRKWCWSMMVISIVMHKLPGMDFVFWQRQWKRICLMKSNVLPCWYVVQRIMPVHALGITENGIEKRKFL